jgi:3-hydroxyacyl-[acyl-carrier-protein] dehydratase
MLINDFYTISKKEHLQGSIKATIKINKSHKIFEGHFPGHPVVPGVCMLQIVREVMEDKAGKALKITGADMIKFLTIINPEENSEVDVSVTYTEENNGFALTATLFSGTTIFFKLKSTLQSA